MRTFLVSLLVAIPMIACNSHRTDQADNTGRNKVVEKTADQAPQSGAALDQTQQIRKAIMDDGSLSTNAHNCKVIVDKDAGTVTLEGPVASADEKARLAQLAGGSGLRVINNLEVKE